MTLIKETDYGTPIRLSPTMVTAEIDGVTVTVPTGTSIMRAAQEMGTKVPKLCATDSLEPFGSCRLCLVEIEGRRGTPASCTTPLEAGMKVHTQSPKLAKLRKGVMELYISDHPLDCLTCAANGDCELQDMAGAVVCAMCVMAMKATTIWSARKTNRIPISPSIRPNASSARAACVPARKCKVPSR